MSEKIQRPSEKAIQAATLTVYSTCLGYNQKDIEDTRRFYVDIPKALQAAYAIDVAPLEKELESCRKLYRQLDSKLDKWDEMEAMIEELEKEKYFGECSWCGQRFGDTHATECKAALMAHSIQCSMNPLIQRIAEQAVRIEELEKFLLAKNNRIAILEEEKCDECLQQRIAEQAAEIERLKEHIKFLRDSHPSLQNQP